MGSMHLAAWTALAGLDDDGAFAFASTARTQQAEVSDEEFAPASTRRFRISNESCVGHTTKPSSSKVLASVRREKGNA
jgi:hypothetical protein